MNSITNIKDEPIKDLAIGDTIKALTLFGWVTAVVSEFGESAARAFTKDGNLGIQLSQDGEGYWETNCSFNAKAVCRVEVID